MNTQMNLQRISMLCPITVQGLGNPKLELPGIAVKIIRLRNSKSTLQRT